MESVGDYLCCCPFFYIRYNLFYDRGRVYDEKSAGFVDIEKILLGICFLSGHLKAYSRFCLIGNSVSYPKYCGDAIKEPSHTGSRQTIDVFFQHLSDIFCVAAMFFRKWDVLA